MKLYYKKPWLIFFIYLRPKVLPTPGQIFRPVSPEKNAAAKEKNICHLRPGRFLQIYD
jgi:hypothetical protein